MKKLTLIQRGDNLKRTYLPSLIIIFALVACNNLKESPSEQKGALNSSDKSQEVNLTKNEKPPSLTITFGEEIVKTRQGGYNWSYLDSTTGEIIGVEAESIPPTKLANIEDAVNITLSKPVILNLENEPLHYEIRAYDNNDNIIATYDDFKDIKENGKAIYEILATWKEGSSTYVFALDVQ